MELTFRFNGEAGDINAPPGFDINVLADGFRMNVPVGYTVTVNPLHPLGIHVHDPAVPHANQNVPNNQNLLNLTEQITQNAIHRVLSQSEVLFLLQNDTMPLTAVLGHRPPTGLFMRPIQIARDPDGHSYGTTHHEIIVGIGDDDTLVKYRWSFVAHPIDNPDNCLTTRRYFFPIFGAKYLIHYLRGNQHVDDGFPEIPIHPVVHIN
ncbi:hypothetical protein N665_0640s0021 [Sinapis alba]|nr:hypothetical protein N665_0640s0021 [Sinapis alba]